MNFFDIKNIAFEIIGYQVSYVELIGTLFGLISVYYASKTNILTWPTGIVNEFFLFILFFQVQLYPDMFLQIYFFIVTIFGWYNWNRLKSEKTVSILNFRRRIILSVSIILFTLISGFLFSKIHLYLPEYFPVKAAYPFVDSFVMVSSIVATVLLAKKIIENWHLWILVDTVCTILYFKKEVYFLSLEYLLFLGLASYGLHNWNKQLIND
jgi:nicotinamide mononucleotide transporter